MTPEPDLADVQRRIHLSVMDRAIDIGFGILRAAPSWSAGLGSAKRRVGGAQDTPRSEPHARRCGTAPCW